MKRVSFEIAKALKEAGYPQDIASGYLFDEQGNPCDEYTDGEIFVRPTYLEVWLWVWRTKEYELGCEYMSGKWYVLMELGSYSDPEEAIIAAIEYLVAHKLIK